VPEAEAKARRTAELPFPTSPSVLSPSPAPADSLSSLRTYLSRLSSSLPSSRTSTSTSTTSSLSPPNPQTRKSRSRLKLLSTPPLSLLTQLSERLSSEDWMRLEYYEKLDAIRLVSRITKFFSTCEGSDPLVTEERREVVEGRRREEELLRAKAGEIIQEFLGKLEGEVKRSELSEAGLWIESHALRGMVMDLEEGQFGKSVQTVFGSEWEDEKSDSKVRNQRIQAIRSGLASLLDSFERLSSRGGGELAFKLVHSRFDLSPIFETVIDYKRFRQETAYNDLLKRQYGILLARLTPSPSGWWEERDESVIESEGRHLVEYLARTGSAGEARKIWEGLERIRLEKETDPLLLGDKVDDEVERLKALTALVDGLIMERFYEDANSWTNELERLAKVVELDQDQMERRFVRNAHRILAKLASNQGRPAILDRLLKRLETLPTTPSTRSTSSSSLETFARRLRVKSSRSDPKSVQAMFRSFQTSEEWEAATKEDQARVWSQVVLAFTRVNNVEAAVKTLQAIVESGLQPPLAAVNSILFGYARRGDVVTVDSLFQQLVQGDFVRSKPNVGSWNALVLVRTVMKDPSAAGRVIEEMQGHGVRPNRQTWTSLMSGLVDAGQWRQAFEVYQYLEQHPSIEFRPDTAVTNVVLKACVLTATPANSVLSLFRQLLLRGFRPNMMTYTLVLQSLTSAGLMDLAEELYLMMDRPSSPSSSSSSSDSPSPLPTSMTPVRPDQFIFSTLIAGYLKRDEKEKARACLAEMRRRGIEPSSITLAIVVGARLTERSTPMKVKQMVAEARKLIREDDSARVGLASKRRSQASGKDRKLVMGDEALAIFAPIFRSAAKQGLTGAALELLEEVQSRRKSDVVPVELYTMLMDAFRRVDDQEVAADNVKTVWDRVYESVAERFVALKDSSSPSSTTLPDRFTSHFLTTSRLNLRVDPAQSSILCVPLTILLDSLARVERHHLLGTIWRALARQGFSFDASNWNTLAIYFARDMQLERAFWISENILCRPHEDDSPVPSPAKFESDFSKVTWSSAVARSPSRLSYLRQIERDQQRKQPLDLQSLLASSPTSTPIDISKTFDDALKIRTSTFWHPYATLLEALETSLETLTLTGDIEVGENEVPASQVKEKLMADHPRTMQAIELWRTRGERKEREKERYLSVQGRSL